MKIKSLLKLLGLNSENKKLNPIFIWFWVLFVFSFLFQYIGKDVKKKSNLGDILRHLNFKKSANHPLRYRKIKKNKNHQDEKLL